MAAPIKAVAVLVALLLCVICPSEPSRKFTDEKIRQYRDRVARMFQHAYNGYLNYAYPYDELRPLTCDGHDTWGSYSLTLVDALDTLAIMGNFTEFRRVAELLIKTLNFDQDINVSVFETNIRVVGGLLSAHLMSKRAGMVLEPGWPCTGPLLNLAEKVARKLLPAFNTSTGMPYGTVNLLYGVPSGETSVTCTAGVATFLIEFGSLTRLTGDPVFEQVAMKALKALWKARSSIGLVGNHIDVVSGKWTALDSGIGAGVDSYFEYLVKGSILLEYPELMEMFYEYSSNIELYLKREDWYMWAHMRKGSITLPTFQSLEAFWPGLQSLIGQIDKGMKTLHNYHQVWKQYGFTPEFYNIPKSEAHTSREGYPLRPELIESTMYLYRATQDPFLLQVGVDILESIERSCRTKCGYSTVKDVRSHSLENRMESFFLAETTKYLYLLFDPDNFIHNTGGHGTLIKTPNGDCVIDAGGYIFNTEAHPVDTAALYCCSAQKKHDDQILQDFHDNVDLLALLDLVDYKHNLFGNNKQPIDRRKRRNLDADEEEGFYDESASDPAKEEIVSSEDTSSEQTLKNSPDSDIDTSAKDNKKKSKKVVKIGRSSGTFTSQGLQEAIDELLTSLHTAHTAIEKKVESSTAKKETEQSILKESTPTVDVPMSKISKKVNDKSTNKYIRKLRSKLIDKDSEADVCRPEDRELEEQLNKLGIEDQVYYAKYFSCPSQPFYMRLSLLGEMFVL